MRTHAQLLADFAQQACAVAVRYGILFCFTDYDPTAEDGPFKCQYRLPNEDVPHTCYGAYTPEDAVEALEDALRTYLRER